MINLIEQSFSKVDENKELFVKNFYSDLFELAPELEYLKIHQKKGKARNYTKH